MQQNQENKNLLRRMLVERSFKYDDKAGFQLTSGGTSRYYIDCKTTALFSKGALLIGKVFFEIIEPLRVKGIGGLTLGADPIANATAVVAGMNRVDLISFVVRKEAKGHGTMKWIEGGVKAGDKVVIIDDVITTGGSTLKAIEKAEESDLIIEKVMVLVDRQEGGRENLLAKGYDLESVFTKTQLFEEYERLGFQNCTRKTTI